MNSGHFVFSSVAAASQWKQNSSFSRSNNHCGVPHSSFGVTIQLLRWWLKDIPPLSIARTHYTAGAPGSGPWGLPAVSAGTGDRCRAGSSRRGSYKIPSHLINLTLSEKCICKTIHDIPFAFQEFSEYYKRFTSAFGIPGFEVC